MSFTSFLALVSGARGVFSDGGSNQEELSYLGVPTVLFRDRSERPDGIGRNIVFRKDVAGGLSAFVARGDLDNLRQPSRLNGDVHPSNAVVQSLLHWTRG